MKCRPTVLFLSRNFEDEVAIKEERERFGDFNFVFRAYSLHTGILYLSNFEIMQRKKGVTGLDFPGDLLLCMFLTYF